jgi:hypothetical protein
MRRSRAVALVILALSGTALWYAWLHSAPRSASAQPVPAGSLPRARPPDPAARGASRPADTVTAGGAGEHGTRTVPDFNHGLRCRQLRLSYGHLVPADSVALLCDGRPVEALRIIVPLADAGDHRALVALFAYQDTCQGGPPPPFLRPQLVAAAQRNGVAAQTVRRLDEALADEERALDDDEIAACHQAGEETEKLLRGLKRQVREVLGREVPQGDARAVLDAQIDYERKLVLRGDAFGEEGLAALLLQKGTPESNAEAITMLRDAATTSPSAKTMLAGCVLRGCLAAPDPAAARELLTEAASAGDRSALLILSSTVDPSSHQTDLNLPVPERYAWSELLLQLDQGGCFGTGAYITWAVAPMRTMSLLAMSPSDSALSQARAAALLAERLPEIRAQLGCDGS